MKQFDFDLIKDLIEQAVSNPLTGDRFIDDRLLGYERDFGTNHPYYSFFHKLSAALEPKFVVELGAWQCTAALCFASGYIEAIVATIDHHGNPGDENNAGLCRRAATLYRNLVYLKGWTWDKLETIKSFNTKIDILFIDGWHQYEYAKKDWDMYTPLLSDNALVICDDIIGGYGPTIAGMLDFWNELPEPKFLNDKVHVGYPMGFLKYENRT